MQIMREEGFKGFYRGCFTNLLRTTPAAAVTFTSFELLSRFMYSLADEYRPAKSDVSAIEVAEIAVDGVSSDKGP